MALEIFDVQQSTPEWFKIRAGLPTASEFSTVLAKGKDGGASVTRKKYMYKLAGEIVSGEPGEEYTNQFLERGKAMEPEARDLYAFTQDEALTRVGFVRNGNKGCSPDSFVGGRGIVEIKTCAPHILIEHILRGEVPPEHLAQIQGVIWVAEREWCDIVCYYPKMPLFVRRSYRDEVYIKKLSDAVDRFNEELADVVARVKSSQ